MIDFKFLGSISHGTLRTQDLLTTFASVLDTLTEGNHPTLVAEANLYASMIEADTATERDLDLAAETLSTLTDCLESFAPKGFYFGTHEGDGSDFGFWYLDNEEED
jgi:hypothetical protein